MDGRRLASDQSHSRHPSGTGFVAVSQEFSSIHLLGFHSAFLEILDLLEYPYHKGKDKTSFHALESVMPKGENGIKFSLLKD
jgi:hypothetical protein